MNADDQVGTPSPPPRRQKKRRALSVSLSLFILVILVIAGTLFGPQLLSHSSAHRSDSPPATPAATLNPSDAPQDTYPHPQLTEHEKMRLLARQYVSQMSLDEELGQLIMVEYNDTSYSADLNTMLTEMHAGGVIMYEFQMLTKQQTTQDIARMQQVAKIPLLISTDEEGGPYVHRLNNIYPPRMSATDIANTGDPTVAVREGHHVAQDLLALGINVNLAPDLDINLTNGYDQVTRTFGATSNSVINYAGPYMKAMQSDGVIACIKHFPGLGAATVDAHAALPIINRTKDEIYATELEPFKHFIQSTDPLEQPGLVMPTDLLMPAIDPVMPAELSHTFMTDILRKEFGYDGVVLTDALYMKGVEINGKAITMPEAGVMALNAGDDMLLGPSGSQEMQEMITALKNALKDGTLAQSRVDEAATRILTLKLERHLMPAVPPQN
ncbi:glycoside hydrolase family 3 N-terminal domain-containing protein [Tengunoibacter tsumagoiensis]|uniref:beta-N-acetylhexosaminidase n=1 Tax=Tengunoibacter tsumagoiensis TaxID=2014871 RepID=A0A401ZU44_9CHLR|nr:glycoside hydrolase family 3 N-terminal domain-containing protein [Tengunoibacter tsumagoiensis]GCE10391.1 hypothetical protein KTT_02500 [Tengunoibacter tsumagoiensis]